MYTLKSVSSLTLEHVYLTDDMDFSGLSLIKLRKEEMESQVSRGDAFNCEHFYFFYSEDPSSSQKIKKWFQQRLKPPVDIPLLR